MRKRMLSLLLVVSVLLSGCGGAAAKETTKTAPETVAAEISAPETTQVPTTEPTLSPEEVLYHSLKDRMKQAVDLGIVELASLTDLNRECTIGEGIQMLQNAYRICNGEESKLLADIQMLDHMNEPAYLGWMGRLPFALYMEALEPEQYQDYEQWMNRLVDIIKREGYFDYTGYSNLSLYWDQESTLFQATWGWYEIGWGKQMSNIYYQNIDPSNAVLSECLGQGGLLALSALIYDQTTGSKLVPCNGNNEIPVEQILFAGEMAEMALRMYYAFCEESDPQPYEACQSADSAILTAELLNRETNLPDASCAQLPSEWRGVTLDDLLSYYDDGNFHYDAEIYEYEIQAVKDAGFNYIGLQLDFSWLQGYGYHRGDSLYGNLDLNRLRKLDQILAWCMERDVHLDLRCTGGGYNRDTGKRWEDSKNNAEKMAEIWSVLARRYADIPNTYLSFTIMDAMRCTFNDRGDAGFKHLPNTAWYQQKPAVEFMKPSVEAIRAISPDRCMIADISGGVAAGEEILSLGVALAADLTADNEFFIIHGDHYLDSDYYLNMRWPYENTCDAESLMDEYVNWQKQGSVREIAAMAQENGLGFMISGWGEIPVVWVGTLKMPVVRYSDEAYEAFIKNVSAVLKQYGYGWCYEEWYGTNGITFSAPLIKNVTYQQIGEYPLYYDTAMLGWFQEINGVA